ncbi:U3 snoRNP protein [Heterostelium album PN500]|uniref:U3 snoRNP protein n=1 Tax=Heterostelium pallidum (strain ATCC 26659 / Pp 5 / PN500) TaxID=670386 RepID=D3B0I7_HETP5|nr:U3 snoRNP protein [Heterostelium album PN500]EFA84811.1 U3 snoRNP protein [Heterostelium album PN500]|eukprot:XP_020436922.1 U3 snoRNP protein [Heterostelium album PN500]
MDRVFTNVDALLEETLKIVSMGVISKAECKEIMKQRQNFEYKLAKKATKKDDFLKYIRYELTLDKMLHQRAREEGLEYDYRLRSPLRHAMILYSCAVHKFSKDESLWLSYLNLRVSRASKDGTTKVFALALQNLPRSATLWKLAAAFEFEVNQLSYISILLNRVSIIKEEEDDEEQEATQQKKSSINIENLPAISDSDKDRFITFGQEMYNAATLKGSSILQGKIASIVFNTAIQKNSKDFEFRKQFYKIVQTFMASGKQNPTTIKEVERIGKILQAEVIGSLKSDFSEKDKRLWTLLAKAELGEKTNVITKENTATFKPLLQTAKQILNSGVDALANDDIIIAIYNLMIKQLKRITIDNIEIINDIEQYILKTLENGINNDILGEDGYYIYVDYLTKLGMKKKALESTVKATTKHPRSVILWNQRMSLLKRSNSLGDNNSKLIDTCFEQAVNNLFIKKENNNENETTDNTSSINCQQTFTLNYIDHKLNNSKLTFKQIIDLFKYSLVELKEAYQLSLQFLPVSRDVLLKCIHYQQESAMPDLVEIRTLYERYFQIKEFACQDTKSWLDYRQFELDCAKNITNANLVANRARKSLKNPNDFIKSLQKVQQAPTTSSTTSSK